MSSDLKKYIFDTETTIPDKNIDTVYDLIMKWLTENNIQVTSEKRPSIIEARHGKKILWTFSSEKMEKKYTFLLNETTEGGAGCSGRGASPTYRTSCGWDHQFLKLLH